MVKPRALFHSLVGVALLLVTAFTLYAGIRATTPRRRAPAIGVLFLVDSTGDGVGVGAGNVCDDGTGHCTLRAAIQKVDARNNGADAITFSVTGAITSANALPNLSVPVSINGPGANQLTVQRSTAGGTPNFSVFTMTAGGAVNISGLTIAHGVAPGSPAYGGGVQNAGTGTLTITNCTLASNSADEGGAVANSSTGTTALNSCTLTNNYAGFSGGAVYNASTGAVTITNTTVSGNSIGGLCCGPGITTSGGGIRNVSGSLTINSSTISGNTGTGALGPGGPGGGAGGGGIRNGGNLTITESNITGNSIRGGDGATGSFGGSADGGGISDTGTLTITRCTVSNNLVTGGGASSGGGALGGGISSSGPLNVTNCTVAANSATGGNASGSFAGGSAQGGGIWFGDSNTFNLTNSTIAANSATGGNGSPAGTGAGGGVYKGNGTVNVKSTIIANNSASSSAPDVSGLFVSQGFNLIGKTDGSTGFSAATDQTGTIASPFDAKLDPNGLQNNGGPTKTIALRCGSPAIDKGTSNGLTGNLTIDQRGAGFARTVNEGIPRPPGGDGTDIGAFEHGAGPIVPSSVLSRKFHGTGTSFVSFDIPLPFSCSSPGIECRRNTGTDTTGPNLGHDHELIVAFGGNITVGSADVVNDSTGSSVGTATVNTSNNVAVVDLHNIPNAVRLSINLRGVSDGTNTGLVSIPMGVLLGDVNATGVLTNADVSLIKAQVAAGGNVDPSNFRDDVNANGVITNADVSLTKAQVAAGAQLP